MTLFVLTTDSRIEQELAAVNSDNVNDLNTIEPVYIPDTIVKEKEAEHERIKKQYEQALKLKQEAEYEMQKALTEQQEAMKEYRNAVREQREVIHEQHRAAREEYRQKLKSATGDEIEDGRTFIF